MKRFIPAVLIATTLVSCGGEATEPMEESTAAPAAVNTLPKVTLYQVEAQPFAHFFSVQGHVESDKNVVLVPEVGGLIKTLSVREGQQIKSGQTIASFDSEIVASNINELKENLKLAKYNFDKQQSLYDQGVGTEFNLEQAKGQYNSLNKTLETLQRQQGKSVLRAPFSGYVEEVFPTKGEMAGPGSPIARLINLDEVYVVADISESYLGKLDLDKDAEISFPALDTVIKDRKIVRLGRFINAANRTVKLRVDLPTYHKFIPNLVADIKVKDYENKEAIVVPSSTILQDENGDDIVYVAVKDGEHFKVLQRSVVSGKSYGNVTEIISGLSAGEAIVKDGSRSVYNNLQVDEL